MDQTIRLDAKKRESSFCEEKIYPLRRGERNNVVLTVQVRADGAPYDLTGKEARLVGTAADGKLVGPCALEVSDAKAGTGSLTLPASMCSAVGTTHAYIEIREGDTLVETTDSFACKVLECADMDAEQAAEVSPLVVELQGAVAEAKRAAEGADAAASHQPRIGGSGTWEVWDAAAGAYVDTGVAAQGPQGAAGAPGSDAAATDVRIAGKSVTADGVADIPLATTSAPGVVGVRLDGLYGVAVGTGNNLFVRDANTSEINSRINEYKPIVPKTLDYAVKAAMCDGKGAAWTAAEQAAARGRLGIVDDSQSSYIWVCLPDYAKIDDDGTGLYTFEISYMDPIYPDQSATAPGDEDILFCGGYVYSFVVDIGQNDISFRDKRRLY